MSVFRRKAKLHVVSNETNNSSNKIDYKTILITALVGGVGTGIALAVASDFYRGAKKKIPTEGGWTTTT